MARGVCHDVQGFVGVGPVEEESSAERLGALGCDTALGWLWSKAVDAAEFTAMLRDASRDDACDDTVVPFRHRTA